MALLGIPWHSSAFFCILLHSNAFLCIPLHSTAFVGILLHSSAVLGIPWHSPAFLCIPWHSTAFLGIPTHFKAFQDFLRHSKAFLGLPRVIQGVPMGSNGFQGRSSKVILRRPKSSKDIQSHSKGFQWVPRVPSGSTCAWMVQGRYAQGPTRGDLRVWGRYARGPTRSRGARCWPKASSYKTNMAYKVKKRTGWEIFLKLINAQCLISSHRTYFFLKKNKRTCATIRQARVLSGP